MNDVNIGKIKYILNIYGNPSYFDLYGTQFMIFILVTILEISFITIANLKKNASFYKANWAQYRCNPTIMPFAGFINKPDGTSIVKYTEQNYQYCIGQSMDNTMDVKFSPLKSLQESIDAGISDFNGSLASATGKTNQTNSGSASTINKGTNIIFIIFSLLDLGFVYSMDLISKTANVLVGSTLFGKLAMAWGSMLFKYFSIAIVEIIALFYATTVYPTTPFWIFIWPILYFILFIVMFVISLEFASWVAMMVDALEPALEPFTTIKTSRIKRKPFAIRMLNFKMPKTSLCFDKNTKLKTLTGYKKIKKLQPGDILKDGMVTSTFKTLVSEMFNLNGIIVSGSHRVLHNSKWIKVKDHPESISIHYRKKYLYCINTTGKTISIKNHIFMDWDELNERKKKIVFEHLKSLDIHKHLDKGFTRNYRLRMQNGKYKRIIDILPGDILENNIRVLAFVKIKGDDLIGKRKHFYLYHLVTDKGYFKNCKDYNYIIDKLFYMS